MAWLPPTRCSAGSPASRWRLPPWPGPAAPTRAGDATWRSAASTTAPSGDGRTARSGLGGRTSSEIAGRAGLRGSCRAAPYNARPLHPLESRVMDIVVNEELKAYIDPLTTEEY